jgi:hypothetical protein
MTCFIKAVKAVMCAALLFVVAAPASAVTPGAEHMTVYDSAEEIEPALISQARSGVDYVVTVYMKFNPDINTASTLQYAVYTSSGQSTFAGLPTSSAVASYTTFADPILAQQEGVTNPRIYLVALAKKGTGSLVDSALIIWSSDNGGLSWTAPQVIKDETTEDVFIDKPAITVGPDGSVHVAYLNFNSSTFSNTMSYLSGTYQPLNDTWSWPPVPTDVLGPSGGNFAAPQVMVDTNDDVYILYVDGSVNTIRLVGKASGGFFAQVSNIPNTGRLYGFLHDEFIPLKTNVSIRAVTVPVARLDRANRRIAAAWHEGDGEGHSQVRFASLETDGMPRTWSNPLVIAAAGGHDINVGMAEDDLGKWLVTYYSFPGTDSYYSPVGTTVYFIGDTPVHDNGNNTIIGRLGDVAGYGQSPVGSGQRYLGEYHDVSYSLGTFKSVHIIVAPIGNPWIFEVTH